MAYKFLILDQYYTHGSLSLRPYVLVCILLEPGSWEKVASKDIRVYDMIQPQKEPKGPDSTDLVRESADYSSCFSV